jgi:hypothetical protein
MPLEQVAAACQREGFNPMSPDSPEVLVRRPRFSS